MMRWLAIGLALAVAAPRVASAKGKHDSESSKDDDSDEADSSDDNSSDDSDDSDAKPKKAKKDKEKSKGDDEGSADDTEAPSTNTLPAKQDLTGHDLGAKKRTTSFEKDRFFVDKVDSDATRNATLIQGSLTWTNFAYQEGGGPYAGTTAGSDASSFSRYFTDFRLQTDFRHIGGGIWDARVDARMRLVGEPDPTSYTNATGTGTPTPNHIQSGLTGGNEYELRELWTVRNGERTDVIIGRQFITDLAAVKIDGVRVDYASSSKLTLLGFGGLYPLRGSRSLTTDYVDLKYTDGSDAGQLVGAGGFGGAYRTSNAYGAVGGVLLLPLQKETARFFGTSNGYWRYGSTIDLYHFALVDLIGNNDALGAGKAGLTNLSAGINYKPNPRLRLTGSFNRVDTETLNVQANAFLSQPQGTGVINDETFIARLSTTEVRGSVSAGLGELQRFEITTAAAYRDRPGFTITDSAGTTTAKLPAASSVEIFGSITDRQFKGGRLGIDGLRTFGVANIAFERTQVTALRVFGAHEFKDGRGEWEAELAYSTNQDVGNAMNMSSCTNGPTQFATCFGSTQGSVLSLGGNVYYRFNRDWFGLASAYISSTSVALVTPSLTMGAPPTMTNDPSITGLTGFARISYRF